MIYVGIDVAKDKHDCCILDDKGKKLNPIFTFSNDRAGFNELFSKIELAATDKTEIKVGLEATGHYSNNLLAALVDRGFATSTINPLHTNLFRQCLSLRKTKTDKADAFTIATMMMSDKTIKPYSDTSYHNEELKSLTRYRFVKVRERAKLKTSVARLINILFPELERYFPTIHLRTVYALLEALPGAIYIANSHLKTLSKILEDTSRGRYGRDKAIEIRDAACNSIGSQMPAKSMELKHTIKLIEVLSEEIDDIESSIKKIMDASQSPIMSIPGISYRMGAMIVAEIGDFKRFSSADKILAYAGLSPTIHQSGQSTSSHSKMEKRGSKYLRHAIFNAAKFVCLWDKSFRAYLEKKKAEGKHYNVAVSHVAKKLIRIIYRMEITGETYSPR